MQAVSISCYRKNEVRPIFASHSLEESVCSNRQDLLLLLQLKCTHFSNDVGLGYDQLYCREVCNVLH